MSEWKLDEEDIAEIKRMMPGFKDLDPCTHNPVTKVFFRAGLLACREYMARFVEQGGSEAEKNIAASIRANWWPSLGSDPGKPRLLNFGECVKDERPDGRLEHADIDPSVEALPYAAQFLMPASERVSSPDTSTGRPNGVDSQ